MPESFAEGLVGVVLDGRYRLDAVVGEGGMGAVFRAHHLAMDRKVAVKLLKPHLTSDEAALLRFAREARSTMKVDSDHAVKILDFGITPHRDYYMVLEYLDGRTVQRELEIDGPFAPARVLHIATQVLHALGAAHAKGLVHRDIKPDNILLMRVGEDPDYAKVLDFGVAKLMDGAARSAKSALAITQAGMVFGTPELMSPEQATGQSLDGRSDLYSLAATMFAMLTGRGMYNASTPIEWLMHHARTPAPHLADGLPALAPLRELDDVLQRCLAKRREDRPRDAAEMIALLAAVAPTLAGPGSVAAPARVLGAPPSAFSPSSYIAAIEPNATLAPGVEPAATGSPGAPLDPARAPTLPPDAALPAPSPAGEAATTTGVLAELQRSRRGVWLVVGAVAIAGTIATSLALATRERPHEAAAAAKEIEEAPRERVVTTADAAPAAIDPDPAPDALAGAVPAVPDSIADAPPLDAAAPGSATREPARSRGRARRVDPAVAAHLAAAEAARQSGNRLRQLAEADAALQADPRNVRARLLVADALIASGDLERGCKHLHALRRHATARARARAAGCPPH